MWSSAGGVESPPRVGANMVAVVGRLPSDARHLQLRPAVRGRSGRYHALVRDGSAASEAGGCRRGSWRCFAASREHCGVASPSPPASWPRSWVDPVLPGGETATDDEPSTRRRRQRASLVRWSGSAATRLLVRLPRRRHYSRQPAATQGLCRPTKRPDPRPIARRVGTGSRRNRMMRCRVRHQLGPVEAGRC